jgi:YegS/Rv2252/BmrU family lipid kinase
MTVPAAHKCVFVIFNPVSGQGDPEARKSTISDALARHGYTSQFIATSKQEGAAELARKALEDRPDLLAVSGGDGTVMEVLSALVGTDVPVAVFPAGTGNLLSVNLSIPMTVPGAVDVALGGETYTLDLARTGDGKFFAIMGGIGLDGQVIADAGREAKRRLGVLAYFWSGLKHLARRRQRVEIVLDGRPPIRRRVKTVMVANMGRITGGVEAVPTASPGDGLLDVVIVRTETLGQWVRLLGYTLMGRAHEDPTFEVHQVRRVTVRSRRPQPVQLDGEEAGRTREWHVEVVPQAVRILVPHDAPAARDADGVPAVVARRRRQWAAPGVALLLLAALIGLFSVRGRHRKDD